MAADLAFAVATFSAIFAIVNPMGATTFFVVLAQDYPLDLKKRVIQKAIVAATVTLVAFAFLGNYIFYFFGTSLPAFEVAGGILLFRVGLSMMQGERPRTQLTQQDREEALQREMVGVVPLGIPMLAGPGAITTVIVLMGSAANPLNLGEVAMIIGSILVTLAIGWVLLDRADRIFHRLGRMGVYAFSRIMGILIAAVAVQFVLSGVVSFLHFAFPTVFPVPVPVL
ncbi:MAG TPA: NAAT family transporter [Thermoplasmata archaeon]|nr:NAAT family transporter [Thermoplasmata archaeon]